MLNELINTPDDRLTNANKLLFGIVLTSLAVRTLFAIFTPLVVDEVYAIAVAREFSWSFYDHPPLGFWSPVFAAKIIGIEHPLVFRLPFLIYGTLTTILVYLIGQELGGKRAGLFSAAVFTVTPVFILGTTFVLPDGPQILGSSFCAWWLVKIAKAPEPAPVRFWLFAGAGLAFAFASKYQAGFIPISALVFVLISPIGRRWFFSPGMYIGGVVALIGLTPVLIWNVQYDWASFAFHGSRTGDGLNLDNFALMIVGQMAYLLPPVALLAAAAIFRALFQPRPEVMLLAILALGPIVFFNGIYLISNSSYAHWAIPGWFFAVPLIGMWMAETTVEKLKKARRWIIGFSLPFMAFLLILVLHFNTGFLTRFTHDTPPEWDRTWDSFRYGDLGGLLAERGDLQGVDMIAASGWAAAGFMSSAVSGRLPVRVLHGDRHHFSFMQGYRISGTALFLDSDTIERSPARQAKMLKLARSIDPDAEVLDPIIMDRGGLPYIEIGIIRMHLE